MKKVSVSISVTWIAMCIIYCGCEIDGYQPTNDRLVAIEQPAVQCYEQPKTGGFWYFAGNVDIDYKINFAPIPSMKPDEFFASVSTAVGTLNNAMGGNTLSYVGSNTTLTDLSFLIDECPSDFKGLIRIKDGCDSVIGSLASIGPRCCSFDFYEGKCFGFSLTIYTKSRDENGVCNLNNNFAWGTDFFTGDDLTGVLIHEFGHTLRLADIYTTRIQNLQPLR